MVGWLVGLVGSQDKAPSWKGCLHLGLGALEKVRTSVGISFHYFVNCARVEVRTAAVPSLDDVSDG